ncbi:hypothetical protein [Tenacibaculum phage Larrie]|nr:hypothetical protein [Tenacibaculum phage Larrie]
MKKDFNSPSRRDIQRNSVLTDKVFKDRGLFFVLLANYYKAQYDNVGLRLSFEDLKEISGENPDIIHDMEAVMFFLCGKESKDEEINEAVKQLSYNFDTEDLLHNDYSLTVPNLDGEHDINKIEEFNSRYHISMAVFIYNTFSKIDRDYVRKLIINLYMNLD